MDVYDRATEIEEAQRDDALRAQRRRAGLDGKTVLDSAIECVLCDDPIPDDRRHAVPGVQLCVDCQGFCERFGFHGRPP
jgi:phage/conjugal plasmid C-4 type zinc finger TraR family protein